jgi:L-ribulose-5-phosphate 3-epimerase
MGRPVGPARKSCRELPPPSTSRGAGSCLGVRSAVPARRRSSCAKAALAPGAAGRSEADRWDWTRRHSRVRLARGIAGTGSVSVYAALNAWTFTEKLLPEAQLEAAAQAGFGGLELVVEADGPLQPETPAERFRELAAKALDLGLELPSLATALFWDVNYGSADAAVRQRAIDLTRQLLDQAAAAGAGAVLVVPAVVGRYGEPRARTSYADALNRTYEALCRLRFDAEDRGVALAIENVWNRFLLSPVELAELIDRVNSPYVGVYLDIGNVLAFGYPQDWINVLGGRIVRVHVKDYDLRRFGPDGFCGLGEGSVDFSAVFAALRSTGYDGPLTYEGPGEPAEICRRLKRLLAGNCGRIEL